jgi:murein DD-endopeptidase MepM/ murein hydrolase activator NlpD
VIYDEEYVDSTSIGVKKIHTAYFQHKGEKFYAIPFVQDSSRDFYNLEGESLRRQFLKAPLRFSRISSGYSLSRMHPVLNYRRPHRGVDYAAPAGTPIHAIGDGQVIDKGYAKGAGYYIKIRHNSLYVTGYNHLSKYARGIREGVRVKQGQTIAYVGSTGYSTGPHLDFRFWKNGHPINPLKVEAPPVKPVKKENREDFAQAKDQCLEQLRGTDNRKVVASR